MKAWERGPTFVCQFLVLLCAAHAALAQTAATLRPPEGSTEMELCDAVAASPLDRDRKDGIIGVHIDSLDTKRAITACRDAVAKSPENRRLLYQLGRALGAAKEHAEARVLYDKSARLGSLVAMNNLAILMRDGLGGPKDTVLALGWLRKAADGGLALAMVNIAEISADKNGNHYSPSEAARWFLRAAHEGDVFSMRQLGIRFEKGDGVRSDLAAAFEWYKKAALLNDAWSMNNLGAMHHNGSGTPRNYAEARYWYEKAIDAGDDDARKTAIQNMQKLPANRAEERSETSSNTEQSSCVGLYKRSEAVRSYHNRSCAGQRYQGNLANCIRRARESLSIHNEIARLRCPDYNLQIVQQIIRLDRWRLSTLYPGSSTSSGGRASRSGSQNCYFVTQGGVASNNPGGGARQQVCN